MDSTYLSTLEKADKLAQVYFDYGADHVSYKEFKGFEALQELYFLARYEGNDSLDTILSYANFVAKDFLMELEKNDRPHTRKFKKKCMEFYVSNVDEAINGATKSNKTILIKKKEEHIAIFKEGIRKHDEKWKNEFTSRLLTADNTGRQFLENWHPDFVNISDLKQDEEEAVVESYLKAFDITNPGSEEEKDFYFHFSDYYLKKSLLSVSEIKKLIKASNRPLTSQDVKKFTDEVYHVINDAIAENDNNKAAYIKKKEEMIATFSEELAKHKIEVKSGGCYIATAVYGSYDCPQVCILRRYRDNMLAQTLFGRVFIHIYYATSPTFVKWFGKKVWFNHFWRKVLDKLIEKLQAKGCENTPYIDITP